MFAGKDFVANAAGLRFIGFADPIYQLCKTLIGSSDKSKAGVRTWLQKLGQWGWGCVSDAYPLDVERTRVVHFIRQHGAELTVDFKWVNWEEYGQRQDFWVNILLQRLQDSPTTSISFPAVAPHRLCVTNARFTHELQPLLRAGFKHYHVMCSENTRQTRMLMKGYDYRAREDEDASEKLAKVFDRTLPDSSIIWNDNLEPMPEDRAYMPLTEFLDRVSGQQQFAFWNERESRSSAKMVLA